MINTIFVIFVFGFVFRKWLGGAKVGLWIALSLLVFLQGPQPTLWAVFALLLIQEVIFRIAVLSKKDLKFLPLIYVAIMLVIHNVFHLGITGFSYILLASSIDLWSRLKGPPVSFKERFFNLVSFPKALVGPITGARDHFAKTPDINQTAYVGLKGIVKCFILLNLWRTYMPSPQWDSLSTFGDYTWFAIWNYVNIYLDFSGACDLVAATFWVYGFACPLNFNRPYLSLSVTEFWKRWHITLGFWIRRFVYIPFGGSRVAKPLIYLNLIIAMTLSGAWHGLTDNYILWGLMQGLILAFERAIGLEERLKTAPREIRFLSWFVTFILINISWLVFFGDW